MILAKENESLVDHIHNALKVFKSIKEIYTDVPKICNNPNFFEHLFYSIFFHDFGKAASGFQDILLKSNQKKRWTYRHEILSAGFIGYLNYPKEIGQAIAMAILMHHKDLNLIKIKYATEPQNFPGYQNFSEKVFELKENIKELKEIMEEYIPKFSKEYVGYELTNFNLPKVEDLDELRSSENYNDPYLFYMREFLKDIEKIKRLRYKNGFFSGPLIFNQYGIFLLGFLIACDHLSSAGEYQLSSLVSEIPWIKNFKLNEIQQKTKNIKGNAILIAPTGYGKTEAALLWAWNNQNETFSKRIFYLLPYIASINAMYNRFEEGFHSKEIIGIIHSKVNTFLYDLYKKDLNNEDEDYFFILSDVRKKINLCKKIYLPLKILTPFQILKAFFQIKGFEQQLSELSQALIIIDEIHAFDARTTALIIEMLHILNTYFNSKVCVMSATIPDFLKKLLVDKLNIKKDNQIYLNDELLNNMKRYIVKILKGGVNENLDFMISYIESNKKVLIVCNTVKKAQSTFERLKNYSKNPILIHSRFTQKDRNKIEKKIEVCNLLIGTQAIEVSLDINFDVLFSEPAPFDALIQRAGRVNRLGHKSAWKNFKTNIYIFSEGSPYDYRIYPIGLIDKTVSELMNEKDLSELKIQNILNKVYQDGFTEEEEKTYIQVTNSFQSLIKLMIPFERNKNAEKSFYNLFKSFEVIPIKYLDKVIKYIEKKQFLKLMALYIPIPDYKYFQLKKGNRIITNKKAGNIEFTDLPYNSELGLIF